MASTSYQTDKLSNLPSELLHQIFVRCEPRDLSSISQLNKALNVYVRDDQQLWKDVYNEHWDTYSTKNEDDLINSSCPFTRSITAINPAESNTNSRQNSNRNRKFDHSQQVKRRTWAERRLKSLEKRPIDLYANYNDTLRTLISIARSRCARNIKQKDSKTDEVQVTTADYLTNLLTSKDRIDIFRQTIYPRNDVNLLREWQIKNISEERSRINSLTNAQRKREEKRARSASATSLGSPEKPKRKRTATNGSITQSDGAFVQSPPPLPKRRSARVQLHNYPTNLHHLLYEKNGNDLITLDDCTGLANLEALELLDEQLAAELHVLHGIHPGFPVDNTKKSNQNNNGNTQNGNHTNGEPSVPTTERSSENESESDDPDFSDHGTPTEGDEQEVSDTDMQATSDDDEEEDEEDNELPGNIFHLFIYRMNANRRNQEPALAGGGLTGQKANKQLRGRAREIVYDTTRFGPENNYGPLRAWRERFEPLDGPRLYTPPEGYLESDGEEGEELEWSGEEDWVELVEPEFEEETDVDEEETVGGDGREIANGVTIEDVIANEEDEEADPNFDSEEEEDEDDQENNFFELRSLAISLSRGILPWAEASQLSSKFRKESKKQPFSNDNNLTNPTADEDPRPDKPLSEVWRIEKRVDWLVVESVMIVMYCNIRHAVLNHGWGKSFSLPNHSQSLLGRDHFARQIHSEFIRPEMEQENNHWEAWRDLIGLPVGWNHSRGIIDDRLNSINEIKEEDQKDNIKSDKTKPYDWAGVESVWIGTYAFLDWSTWAAFNARDPQARGLPDPRHTGTPDAGPFPIGHNRGDVTLAFEREAIGDCLQLKMELLPLEDQVPHNDYDSLQSYLEGYDEELIDLKNENNSWRIDPNHVKGARSTCQKSQNPGQYPPLRFRGRTLTYLEEGEALPRGECYGVVRPIYAPEDDCHIDPSMAQPKNNQENKNRSIVALQWEITHRYANNEGINEDAWALCGIQAGPPGTRSPIYGIWGSAQRRDNMGPCGPFAYYKVDERV